MYVKKRRTGRGKPQRKRVGKRIRKGKRVGRMAMVNRSPVNTIVPPRYFTKLKMLLAGYIPAGYINGIASVFGNTLYQPLLTPYSLTGLHLTPVAGTNFTQQFPGYSQLTALYQYYRVHSSSLKVVGTCSGVGDTYTLATCAIPAANILTITTLNVDGVLAQPHGKFKLLNPFSKNCVLKSYTKCHNIVGLTKPQYNDQLPNKLAGTIGSAYGFEWVIYWATNDGAVTQNQLYMDIELEYWVEFNSPINAIN
jgi:hypothetical protein